jgi:CheY-like chemotaxis protein/DNA-directed RNA polymerase specialized sigma24 family protein
VRSIDIIQQLPDLRRYAEALVGTRSGADLVIELCLDRLLANQAAPADGSARLVMFATFDLVYDGAAAVADIAPGDRDDDLRSALRWLPDDERKALLLVTVARFSYDDAAAILRVSRSLVARRVLAAREHLRESVSLKVLVIEDDVLIAMSISQIVTHMGHDICGVAQTTREALARDRTSRPDLIVADVWLRDGDSGVVTVQEIRRRREVPVIFVTGHAKELVAERQLRHTVVIAKPFAAHTLEVALRRAALQIHQAGQPGL